MGGLQKGPETPVIDLFDDGTEGTGKYPAHHLQDGPGTRYTLYAPKTPPPASVKLPVLVYAACGGAGTSYTNLLTEVASHGYLVIAAGPPGPKMPSFNMSSIPKMPAFNMSNLPKMPAFNISNLPKMPAFNFSSLPKMPAFNLSAMPKMPAFNMSAIPKMPKMGGQPRMPAFNFTRPVSTDVTQMKNAIDWVLAGKAAKYGNIDIAHIATGGFSCGGLQVEHPLD
jgi:hypothetical protein